MHAWLLLEWNGTVGSGTGTVKIPVVCVNAYIVIYIVLLLLINLRYSPFRQRIKNLKEVGRSQPGSMSKNTAVRRLRKEYQTLQQQPEYGFVAAPIETNVLEWHFVLFGSVDTPYQGGLYHGRLIFPSTYPMSPPAVYMRTESGRFKVDTKICMSMSDFHPEQWNPMWGVRLILIGMLSFMNSEEPSTGAMTANSSDRVMMAQRSLVAVKSDPVVIELFPDILSQADSNLECMNTWPPRRPLPMPTASDVSCAPATTSSVKSGQRDKIASANQIIVAAASNVVDHREVSTGTGSDADATINSGATKSKSAKNNARRRAKTKAAKQQQQELDGNDEINRRENDIEGIVVGDMDA